MLKPGVKLIITPCSIFESSIRYVAGMLSAYQLSGEQDDVLVEKAKQLADKLILGWVDVRSHLRWFLSLC